MAQVKADDVRKYVMGITVPATPDTIVAHARQKGAPSEVLRSLEQLPAGEWHTIDRIVEAWERASASQ